MVKVSTSGVISIPFSTTFEMENTANDIAANSHSELSARRNPGSVITQRLQYRCVALMDVALTRTNAMKEMWRIEAEGR